jgi:ATP-dependent RNA helicase DHX29
MAGKKKAKKPAANPARGFATTSVASKPRADLPENSEDAAGLCNSVTAASKAGTVSGAASQPQAEADGATVPAKEAEKTLSPEEFERQLEESELQLMVEKYAQKVRRDVQRQKNRLESDRRVLRGQAETVNTRKWLPSELMDHIIDLIQAESRFAASSITSENNTSAKALQEEDVTIKLWTLQETLVAAGFPDDRIQPVLRFVLDIASNVTTANRDSIWGLDEALEWLARECVRDELPDYEGRGKKSQAGKLFLDSSNIGQRF